MNIFAKHEIIILLLSLALMLGMAKVLGVKTIGLTGESGGVLKEECDVCICAPASVTARVQEYHQVIYHHLCEWLEQAVFGNGNV